MPITRTRVVRGDDIPTILRRRSLGGGHDLRGAPQGKEDKAATVDPGINVMAEARRVHYVGGRMLLPCADDDSLLEVLEVRGARGPQGMDRGGFVLAKEFMRGLGRTRRLFIALQE